MKIRRINFIGGPGAGKSTQAARLFVNFKEKHAEVELAQEYCKLWAYEQRVITLADQVHIFAEQQRRELIPLRGGTDLVISDSPLTLCACYAKKIMPRDWELLLLLAKGHERDFPSLNIFLRRDLSLPYKELGRYQTREQALEMDQVIFNTLNVFDVPMVAVSATDHARIATIVDDALKGKHASGSDIRC